MKSSHFRKYHLLQILNNLDSKIPLDLYLNRYFRLHKSLGSKDRKVIGDTIYGLIRWKGLLDHICGQDSGWEKKLSPYQGIDPLNCQFPIPLHHKVSFPETLFSLLLAQYGEKKAIQLCLISNTAAKTTIRVNPLKIDRKTLLQNWKNFYSVTPTPLSPLGITFNKKISLFQLPEFKEGLFEIQDEASQLVSALIRPKKGDLVLDYCAGSGGKTLAFAHHLENSGQIFLHDIRSHILLEGKKRLKRAGIQNAQLLFPDSLQLKNHKKKMDWVVVDAPCSGSGTYRRNPDMKWRFTPKFLKSLVLEQRKIFEKALSFAKPGGVLVYITCSLLEEENEAQVTYFLKNYDLKLVSPPLKLLPQKDGMDGFFGAVLTSPHFSPDF